MVNCDSHPSILFQGICAQGVVGLVAHLTQCSGRDSVVRTVNVSAAFSSAVQQHQSGRIDEAERIYEQILALQPGHADALHLLGVIAHQKGDDERAVTLILQAIERNPNALPYYTNLGEAYRMLGRFEESLEACRMALKGLPNSPEVHNNLGNALKELNRLDEAAVAYARSLQLNANNALTQNNLANTLRELGQLMDSVAAYRRALKLKPNYAEAHNGLGLALKDQGTIDEAIACYQRALALKPSLVEAHCNLGIALRMRGKPEEAVACFRRAVELRPNSVTARAGLAGVLGVLVPYWHAPMMSDDARNEFYQAALNAVITEQSTVVEIGTGSGLLAMMAARAGAVRVTTCESIPLIAETARKVVADNGFAEKIKVISKRSTALKLGEDVDAPADVLVSEIFSSEFLGEQVLASIEDAKRRLLKPGGRVVPAAGSIMIALFAGDDIATNLRADQSCGFDLRAFNAVVAQKQSIARNDLPIELLSDEVEAFFFDFQRDSFFPSAEKTLRIPVKKAGKCLGIIQWIRFQMSEKLLFENHPLVKARASSWQHITYLALDPVEVREGQVAVVSASHNRRVPWFAIERVE